MPRLVYILPQILLFCACSKPMNSAMTSTVLAEVVDTSTPLSVVYFYEDNGIRYVEVTSNAPYISDGPVIGYETYKNGRKTNYVVFLAESENFEIPPSILNVSQLSPRDSVLDQLSASLEICFGWGTVYTYRIVDDSLVYDHMEIIE